MEHSLHYQLRACHTNCQKAIITKLRQTGDLRPGEPKILEFLLEHEPCEQKTIAAGCGLDPASVTGILGRMESRGLVTRACRDGNRRSLFVTMTDYGRTLAREVEENVCTGGRSGGGRPDCRGAGDVSCAPCEGESQSGRSDGGEKN